MPGMLDAFDAADKAAPAASQPSGMLAAFDDASSAVKSEPKKVMPGQVAQATATTPRRDPLLELVANQVSSLGSTVAGGYRGLWSLATGEGADAAANAVQKTQQDYTYQPKTEVGRQFTDAFTSKYNPLNWVPMATEYAGRKLGDVLADAGAPAAGAIVAGAGAAAPLALGIKGVRTPLADAVKAALPFKGTAPAIAERVDPVMVDQPKPRFKLVNGKPVPVEQVPVGAEPVQPVAATTAKPAANQPVNAGSAANEPFPEVQTVSPKGSLPKTEQARRADVLASIGLQEARQSAVTGDALSASTDHQTAKLDNAAGRLMRDKLAEERSALLNATDAAIERTGGTRGLNQDHLQARGETISGAVQSLNDWANEKASQLYLAANEKAQGVPTELEGFRTVLGDDSHITNTDAAQFRQAAVAKAKQLNIIRDDGSVFSDGLQAEAMRKWLNSQTNPALGSFVRELKGALDKDVLSSAGSDVYAEARKLWAWKKDTLDNPKGIAQVGSASGPDGINRAIPLENIPGRIASMPAEQFGHIVKTLKEAPPEVQTQATAALNEIKAQFANELQQIGNKTSDQWNARGVREYLNKRAAVMGKVFTPEEMAAFRNISDAGQILSRPGAYPGAAVQAQNLGKAGVFGSVVQHGATTGGAAIGSILGPLGSAGGAAAGRALGDSIAAKSAEASAAKRVQKRFVRLSDITKPSSE